MNRSLLRTSFVQLHAEDKKTSNYQIHLTQEYFFS